MKLKRIYSTLFLTISFCLLTLTCFNHLSIAQTKSGKPPEPEWKTALYEKDVEYGNFACHKEDAEKVAAYFKERPLRRFLPICHNNCPVVDSRPVIPYPRAAIVVGAKGTVFIHILVDEQGNVLYARAFSGHPLLRGAAYKGACETKFKKYEYGKQQGIIVYGFDRGGKYP